MVICATCLVLCKLSLHVGSRLTGCGCRTDHGGPLPFSLPCLYVFSPFAVLPHGAADLGRVHPVAVPLYCRVPQLLVCLVDLQIAKREEAKGSDVQPFPPRPHVSDVPVCARKVVHHMSTRVRVRFYVYVPPQPTAVNHTHTHTQTHTHTHTHAHTRTCTQHTQGGCKLRLTFYKSSWPGRGV